MRKLLMLVLFVFWSLPAFAQEAQWSRTYGGSDFEYGWSVQQTTDGGYIVTGETESFGAGGGDVFLVKTNSVGDTLWSRTYGGSERDVGLSVRQTTDGGYIVAGYTYSFGAGDYSDVYLIKTDSNGDTLWTRAYRGTSYEFGYSVQQTSDGGYIIGGETYSFGAGLNDVYLIKTDSNGDTLWTRTYGTSSYEYGRSVQQTTDGGYIVVGWTYNYPYDDLYLIKTDYYGDTLWTRIYEGSDNDRGYSVQQTTDGGYIVTGYTYSFGARDVYLIKTNSIGDTLWTRIYGGGDDEGVSVQQTPGGGYIVTGRTSTYGAGNYDIMLTKLDSLGNTCIGEFVSSTVMSVYPTVTGPATVVTSPSPAVISPTETVTSPATVVTTVCILLCGDVNGDGVVDIGDASWIINYLFAGGPAPNPLCIGDANCDGAVDIGDASWLINWLFAGGPPACSECCDLKAKMEKFPNQKMESDFPQKKGRSPAQKVEKNRQQIRADL